MGGSIGTFGKVQFPLGIVPVRVDFFGQGNWVWKWIHADRPVPHHGKGFGQHATPKPNGHILSAGGPLSTSTLQFWHCWLWVAWSHGRWCKRIPDCRRMGENHRWKTILANMYSGGCSPSGATNPARTLGIFMGDCQYRSLRVTDLMTDRPSCLSPICE